MILLGKFDFFYIVEIVEDYVILLFKIIVFLLNKFIFVSIEVYIR